MVKELTVKAEVLGVGLGADELKAALHEVAHRPRVLVQVARREALVRAVEEREQLALLHNTVILYSL
jgi:hypothetical protein